MEIPASEEKIKKSVLAPKKPSKDTTTQRYLPFSEIRDNIVIMKDGSSRMVLKVHALNFNLKSTEEQDAILLSYQRFLNSLRFPIQIIVRSLKVDIESYINKLKGIAGKQKNPLLQEQTYRYIDFLLNLIDLAQIMRKDFYIVVPFDTVSNESVRTNGIVGIFQSFWSSINNEDSVATMRLNRQRTEMLKKGNFERLNMLKTGLEGIGLRSEEVKKDELIKLLYNYYNPRVNVEAGLKADIDNISIT